MNVPQRTPVVSDARQVLTLLAGFAIGIHVAVFLHELGHALGSWFSGGVVTAIVMQAPLPAGYVLPRNSQSFMYVWGGVVIGSLFALPPLAFAWRLAPKATLRFVALMVAALCLAHNALYLFVGGLAPYGDAEDMIKLGAPRWLLVLFGLPLLAGFVFVLALAIRMVGVRPEVSVWRWILVIESGLLPIPAAMVAGAVLSAAPESVKLSMLVLGGSFAACFCAAAICARFAARSLAAEFEKATLPQKWSITVALFAGALLLVLVEWLAFRPA